MYCELENCATHILNYILLTYTANTTGKNSSHLLTRSIFSFCHRRTLVLRQKTDIIDFFRSPTLHNEKKAKRFASMHNLYQ